LATFPERALGAVNGALTALVDFLFAPVVRIAPLTSLVVVAAATGLAMLWVVGRTSNQAGIADAKRGIHAALFEIRLFNDNLGAVLRALGRVLWQNGRYLGYSLVPLVWVAVPLMLIVAQLQAFYGYQGLTVGAPVLLTTTLRDARAASGAITVHAPDGIRVETGAVVLPGASEVIWRIVPTAPGDYALTARIGSIAVNKTAHVADGPARRSPFRVSSLFDLLLYPSEPPVPENAPISQIALPYPEPGVAVLGWRVHWMILYVGLSMITAFAFAKRLGVTL
jgi:uncharacterized membrane protein YedE/YeeE